MRRRVVLSLLLMPLLLLAGCSSMVYQAYEAVGVPKRDLLKKYVVAARDEQAEASQEFEDALTRLRRLYQFDGGDLEKAYDAVKTDHDDLDSRRQSVSKRVSDVRDVAKALFKEWEKELDQYASEELRNRSRAQLRQTKSRYEVMEAALTRAETSMAPVLARLKDQVLFLKHNLNAAAIASLRNESADIQREIGRLLEEMRRAIERADEFVREMP